MTEIILVGGGGHCKACIDVIESNKEYEIAGVIDLPSEIENTILGYDVIGNDDDLSKLAKTGKSFLITLGNLGNGYRREELFNLIKENGGNMATIVSPYAMVSKHCEIGEGTIVMHNAILSAGSKIGMNCIINTKALIEHDSKVGNNCHISTDVNVNGNCVIENNVFVGSGSTVKNEINIGAEVIIGAGAVVVKNIKERGVYVGNPAEKMNK